MRHRLQSAIAACLFAATAVAGTFRDTGDGVAVRLDRIPSEPWAIQIVRFDRNRTNLVLQPTLGLGDRIGLGTLTEQIGLLPSALGEPLAAINGDFYQTENESFPGDPRGLLIRRGELVSGPTERDCFWIDTNGAPNIGMIRSGFTLVWPDGETNAVGLNEEPSRTAAVLYTAAAGALIGEIRGPRLVLEPGGEGPWLPLGVGESYRTRVAVGGFSQKDQLSIVLPSLRRYSTRRKPGDNVNLSTQTTPDLRGVRTAIGGGPALLRAGRIQPTRVLKARERHPRSAIGWNQNHFFLVTVDGRQPGYSAGMTLPELAGYLAQLGCTEAMNLDGGGSTELWLRSKILNRPCYGHERRTATGLVLLRSAPDSLPSSPARQ